jgi:ketosteroid isomerase-like protein
MHAAALPHGYLDKLFTAIDAKDAAEFATFLAEDGVFRFGSAPTVTGRAAIQKAVAEFFDTIDGLAHSVSKVWRDEHSLVCEGEVCYRRLDGREVIVPFVDVFECAEGLIASYKIYMDIAPLYAD